MKKPLLALILLLGVAAGTRAQPAIKALTTDGRTVLLKSDQTWEYLDPEPGDPATSAVLTVTKIREMQDACYFQFRLKNNLGYRIKSLVPSFSAYTRGGVLYETVSKAFSSIKPTLEQYRQIQFIGLRCKDIDHILVHGADHCHMGPLDKFTENPGKCLGHIYVQASDQIAISK